MKFHKLSMAVALVCATLGFTACSDDDTYEKGKPSAGKSVGFPDEEMAVLALADTKLEVTLTRRDTQGALTVPIRVYDKPSFVTVPATVTFADGAAETTLILEVGQEMEAFTEYWIRLGVDEAFTDPYSPEAPSPFYNITMIKEDYKLVANCIYDDTFWYEAEIEAVIEYSPMKNLYRMPSVMADGVHYYFFFNGSDEFYFTDAAGKQTTKFFSGAVHSTYGNVYVNVESDEANPMGYDPATATFFFPTEWTVSAGSFGGMEEYIYVTEWFEKPWENK